MTVLESTDHRVSRDYSSVNNGLISPCARLDLSFSARFSCACVIFPFDEMTMSADRAFTDSFSDVLLFFENAVPAERVKNIFRGRDLHMPVCVTFDGAIWWLWL